MQRAWGSAFSKLCDSSGFFVGLKVFKSKWSKLQRGAWWLEQPRQSNWDLWILNWIQIELRPSRRNRGVRTGFRRSGDGGRADLWPCVEAEIAPPAQYRTVERRVHNLRKFLGSNKCFAVQGTAILHFEEASSDCCGRRTTYKKEEQSHILEKISPIYMGSAA